MVLNRRVPVAGPWVTEKEIEYVADAAANDWYENAGNYVRRFEAAFAEYAGRQHAITLPSCTSGLHLSLLALGVGEGDEVIAPDVTWIASVAPISYVGAVPVLVDIDASNWCISADALAAAITERTKAVIAVDLYGSMPDMDAVLAVAAARGIPVIEDAAEAIGSRFGGRLTGSFGETSVFSFHGSKTLTTGEGGIVLTDRKDLHDRMTVLRDHGRLPGDATFFNAEVGHKYKMSSLQAAFGLAQLERVEELVDRKRQQFAWYGDRLADLGDDLRLNPAPAGADVVPWMVTAVFGPDTGLTKEAAGAALAAEGMDSRPFFHPLSSIPAYAGTPAGASARERNPVSYDLSPRAINLPSALRLTEEEIEAVALAVRRLLGRA